MKIKILQIGFFLFLNQLNIAQISYSTSQLQDFVTIYMDAKESKSIGSFEMLIEEKLAEHNISYARYREIFHLKISGVKIDLSANEESFLNGIQEADNKIKREKSEAILNLCSSKSIDYETYLEIQDKYKTDIKFQRSLKPYFDHYLKTKK